MSNKLFLGVIVVVLIGISAIFFNHNHMPKNTASAQRSGNLSSVSAGHAPWPAEWNHLQDRMQAIGLSLLGAEGAAQHIHAHLDVYIHGTPTAVPANIGIISTGISPVHTHDTSGIVHIESDDANAKYTLGQFFNLWGVKFTDNSIGSYKADNTNKLAVYDNGAAVSKPTDLKLSKHHEIAVVFGTTGQQPKIPKSYTFTNGL